MPGSALKRCGAGITIRFFTKNFSCGFAAAGWPRSYGEAGVFSGSYGGPVTLLIRPVGSLPGGPDGPRHTRHALDGPLWQRRGLSGLIPGGTLLFRGVVGLSGSPSATGPARRKAAPRAQGAHLAGRPTTAPPCGAPNSANSPLPAKHEKPRRSGVRVDGTEPGFRRPPWQRVSRSTTSSRGAWRFGATRRPGRARRGSPPHQASGGPASCHRPWPARARL